MPPIKTKTRATAPAVPINQLMALVTKLTSSTQAVLTQSLANEPLLPRKAIRIVLSMTLESRTMARPIKARVKVFLPAATLVVSPAEKIYM